MNGKRTIWLAGIIAALAAVVLIWHLFAGPAAVLRQAGMGVDDAAKWKGRPHLVMFTEEGCQWCERFRREVLPIYPKTEEGGIAPLRIVDVHAPRPADLRRVGKIVYTPTFVLIDSKGRIVGRIEGYPGYDFFWARLNDLFERMRAQNAQVRKMNGRENAAEG